MARNTRTFTDLDFNFFLHPKTKDVSTRSDEDAVKQSLRNLLLTRNFERPFRSFIGSPVQTLLFEPMNPLTIALMERTIINVIDNYEPRIDLLSVRVLFDEDNNEVLVIITFRLKNTQTPITANIVLERTR